MITDDVLVALLEALLIYFVLVMLVWIFLSDIDKLYKFWFTIVTVYKRWRGDLL